MEYWTARAVPALRCLPQLFFMFSLNIRRVAKRACGCMWSFTMLDRFLFGNTRSTRCCWSSLRYQNRDDPQCRGTSVRKIIDIIIRFINTSIRASYFLISCKLKPNMKVFLSFDFKTSCGRCNGGRWNSDGKQSAAYFDNQLTVSCRTFKEHMMLNHPSRSKGDFLYLLMAIQGTAFENIIVPFTRYASKGSRLLRFS